MIVRAGRVVRLANYMRMLGGMTVSALSDTFRPVMVHGLTRVMGDGLAPLVSNAKLFKLAAEEAKLAGTALDIVLNTRIMHMADVFDDFGRLSKFERGLQGLANNFGLVSLMSPWNAAWKQFSGIITQTRMLQGAERWASLPAKEREYLAWLGIDQNAADRIAAQFRAHGKQEDGVWWANTQAWSDREAVAAFRAGLVKDVDRTIVTPGQDKPLMMSTELGKMVFQFKTFNVVSTQRTALAALQQRDAVVLNGALGMFGFGMLSYALSSIVAGKELPDDPAKWIANGLDRSGLFFWLTDVVGTGGKLLGVSTVSRYDSRNAVGALLGPSFGTATDMVQVMSSAGQGDWRASDTTALRRLVPYQNLFYLRWLFDQAEEGINDALGVPMTARQRK